MNTVLSGSLKKGSSVLIFTVTHNFCGIITDVDPSGVRIEPSHWLGDIGEFDNCLKTGKFAKSARVEGGTTISMDVISFVVPWPHAVR